MLTGRDGKLLVDADIPGTRARITDALDTLSADPVRHLINTHWHFDHTDGNEWLHSMGAEITAHENTRKHLAETTRVEDWDFTFPPALPALCVASLSFEGDLAASLFHLDLIDNDISNWKAKSQVVAIFHTNAGHVPLHDQAYNTDRHIATGNPYRKLVTHLMGRGVQVELCGATAKAHGWGNADLTPGIKINTDAMARATQLV